MATNPSSSYVDITKLTAEDFSPYSYANSLVLSTNNPSDTSIDLTTPLSRALFDLQEIDSNIHTLTSRSALDIINYTSIQNGAAQKILSRVEEERARLNSSYARLETEVLGQYNRAINAKLNAERSYEVVKLGRSVQRIVNIARQFEATLADAGLGPSQTSVTGRSSNREDHRALLRASYMILTFRDSMSGDDAADLGKLTVIKSIRGRIFEDGEARILDYARRIVREFSFSTLIATAGPTFKDSEDARARFTSSVHILYLLSPAPKIDGQKMKKADFEPEYLIRSLQAYLQTAITSSSAGIARALAQLPTLDRALMEVSARCQNVIAFEVLLKGISPPQNLLLQTSEHVQKQGQEDSDEELNEKNEDEEEFEAQAEGQNLLSPLLTSLDTSSLPSYFWRSLASSLTSRVQEIMSRGGVSARTLKSNKDTVRAEIRDCVLRGSKMPSTLLGSGSRGKEEVVGNWEREAAVMVGSVIGPLNR